MERMLGAELTSHLGYEASAEPPPEQSNWRNGIATKRVKGSDGEVPRDRDGSFEPELVKKGQTRIDGVDDKIIGLYAVDLSVRDIQANLDDQNARSGLLQPANARSGSGIPRRETT